MKTPKLETVVGFAAGLSWLVAVACATALLTLAFYLGTS